MAKRLVLLAALGYFIDIVDIFLFSVLRVPSLTALGVPSDQLFSSGSFILNWQMGGLLLGSLFWGVLGDKRGRLSVLYGSILLYSLATLANALVQTVPQYAFLRFLAGIGLAGELGAAITLVSETLSTQKRGVGTTIVAGVGLSGGIVASLLSAVLTWRMCYVVGGLAGLVLLVLRLKLNEPEMFKRLAPSVAKGDLSLFLKSGRRVWTFFNLILVGVPIYYVAGILMVFSPELSRSLGVVGEPVTAAKAVMFSYIGVSLGDFLSGFMSQVFRQRKTVITFFLGLAALGIYFYFGFQGLSTNKFYLVCFGIGISSGYWVVLITSAAEHYGTNLRSTVSTVTPNLIRASVIPMISLHHFLTPHLDFLSATKWIGVGVIVLAFFGLFNLRETYGTDLDFIES